MGTIMPEAAEALLKKLKEIEGRFEQIERQIAETATARNPSKLISLAKEQGRLKETVFKYRKYTRIVSDIADTEQLLNAPNAEKELIALARHELAELQTSKEQLLEQLKDTLVMAEEMDVKGVIMEIRAGTGGGEAALFVRDLYNMYVKYAERRRWKMEQLSFRPTEMGGLREIIFSLKGTQAWLSLRYESGAHRVQRVPETESQGRVHTSAATVAVMPEPQEINVHINPDDVLEHVSRSGGPGGQSVNKLNSAIKLEHTPTGITVSMRDEKSQHKNRAKAWRILRSRIFEHYENQKMAQMASKRKNLIGTGDRSEKIRTYNFPQNRVTDHRINLSLYCLDKVLAGDLSEIIEALREHDKQQKLQEL